MQAAPDLAELAIALGLLGIVVLWPAVGILRALHWVTVGPGDVGLVYRHGKFSREIGPGRHLLWPGATLRRVTMISQTLHVRGYETTSQDGWTVVLSALVTFQIADGQARAALEDDVLTPLERVRHAVGFALFDLSDRYDLAELLTDHAGLNVSLRLAMEEVVWTRCLILHRVHLTRVRFNPLARRYLARLAATRVDDPGA